MVKKQDLKDVKVVFMGSPAFAVPIAEALHTNTNLVLILTQPDKPAGRGKRIISSEVKQFAVAHQIPVLEPRRLRKDPDAVQVLRDLEADVFIVAAYGQILPSSILNIPHKGCLNVHASLLPRWRGASPIQAAILHGDTETGVTIMKMDEGMDTGAIITQKSIPITEADTADTLSERLSLLGRDLLMETLPSYLANEIELVQQNEVDVTYASIIKKEDGFLDPEQTADELERKVRAYQPWPGTYLQWDENVLKVLKADVVDHAALTAGERGILEKFPVLGTASGGLRLLQVQIPGRNPISGKEYLNGARNWLEE